MSVAEERRAEATEDQPDKQNTGRIEEIQGVVIEAVFPEKLPEINHAIRVRRPDVAKAEEQIAAEASPAEAQEWLVCEVITDFPDDMKIARERFGNQAKLEGSVNASTKRS